MRNTLSEWTTIGIGGAARRIDVARTKERLTELAQNGLTLGGGSNVLVSDDGYDGNVVINRYTEIIRHGDFVTAASGVRLPTLCVYLADAGLTGLEWAAGIPGSVGGAVRMNAGAFGGSVSDRLAYAEILRDGRLMTFELRELGFGYRESALLPTDVVVSATFALGQSSSAYVKARCAECAAKRRSSQPVGKSAGSVFKNVGGVSVGKLFDKAGLKGLRSGGAAISKEHANIIVNTGGATAHDVTALIAVMKRVLSDNGVAAQEEIKYIGGF